MKSIKDVELEWRLFPIMADRGYRTSIDLHRELHKHGVQISSVQLSRIVKGRPGRLNTQLLLALMVILECQATDLLRLEIGRASCRERVL